MTQFQLVMIRLVAVLRGLPQETHINNEIIAQHLMAWNT